MGPLAKAITIAKGKGKYTDNFNRGNVFGKGGKGKSKAWGGKGSKEDALWAEQAHRAWQHDNRNEPAPWVNGQLQSRWIARCSEL